MAVKTTRKARAADLSDFNLALLDDGNGSLSKLAALVDDSTTLISKSNPLPVWTGPLAASGMTPVTGTFTAAGQASASFTPVAGRDFNWTIWGTFVATIALERSFDLGANWHALTGGGTAISSVTAAASEIHRESESSVLYRLRCSAFTSGTVNYRISQ